MRGISGPMRRPNKNLYLHSLGRSVHIPNMTTIAFGFPSYDALPKLDIFSGWAYAIPNSNATRPSQVALKTDSEPPSRRDSRARHLRKTLTAAAASLPYDCWTEVFTRNASTLPRTAKTKQRQLATSLDERGEATRRDKFEGNDAVRY